MCIRSPNISIITVFISCCWFFQLTSCATHSLNSDKLHSLGKIGVVSLIGDKLHIVKRKASYKQIGTNSFDTDRHSLDITNWQLDDYAAAAIINQLQDQLSVNHLSYISSDKSSATSVALLKIAKKLKFDTLLILEKLEYDYLPSLSAGINFYREDAVVIEGQPSICITAQLQLVNVSSREVIVSNKLFKDAWWNSSLCTVITDLEFRDNMQGYTEQEQLQLAQHIRDKLDKNIVAALQDVGLLSAD